MNWLVGFILALAHKTPFWDLPGYMRRWWLFGGSYADDRPEDVRGWRGTMLDRLVGRFVRCRIHQILRSDNERDLHCHPWPYMTIILRGGYLEVTPCHQYQPAVDDAVWARRRWHGPGSIIFRRATDRHRLEVPAGETATTMFFMFGGKSRQWGFHTDEGFVPAFKYSAWNAARTKQ